MRILVLEDSDDRIHAMRDIVLDRFGAFDIRFFKSCRAMQEAIDAEGLADVALISLDHDLEMLPGPEGRMIDPGTGVDMAEWLATQQPKCPVIVQTTNTTGGREMATNTVLLTTQRLRNGFVTTKITKVGSQNTNLCSKTCLILRGYPTKKR